MNNLSGLQEFVAVVDGGTFTAAAAQLRVSVSHISRQIAVLEARLKVRLFERSTRKMALTDEGRRLHQAIHPLLQELLRAQDGAFQESDALEGEIRVSLAGRFAEERIVPLLAEFCGLHPAVRIDIDMSPRNVDLIGEGFDLAVRMGPLEPVSTLKSTRLVSVPFMLVGTSSFVDAQSLITSPRDLDPTWCLPLGGRRWQFQRGRSRVEITPAGRIGSNNGAAAVQAALAGLGLALVPADYARPFLASGLLRHLLPDWKPADANSFHLVFPAGRYMPRRIRCLIDLLQNRLRSDSMHR